MNNIKLRRFEVFILKPLSILLIPAVILSFIIKAWLVGIILIVDWFFIGFFGQALNKSKSIAELMQGTGYAIPDSTTDNNIIEKRLMYKTVLSFLFLIGMTSGFIFYYFKGMLLLSLLIGFVSFFDCGIITFLIMQNRK